MFLVHSAIPHSARVIMQLQESFRVDLLHCLLKQRASHPDPTLYITINSNPGALESKVRTKWIVLCCYLRTALFICQKSFLRAGRLCWIEGNRLICDSVARASAPKLNICHFIWHLVVKCDILHHLILKGMSVYFIFTERHWSSFIYSHSNIWVGVSVGMQRIKMPGKKNWALTKVIFLWKKALSTVCVKVQLTMSEFKSPLANVLVNLASQMARPWKKSYI